MFAGGLVMKAGTVEAKVTLRAKSQVTLPRPIVRKLGLKPGDDLVVWVQEGQPEVNYATKSWPHPTCKTPLTNAHA